MKLPIVICAVCHKQVDRLDWWHDPRDQVQKIVAHCHGEKDTMELELHNLTPEQLRQLEYAEGVAFSSKRIEVKE